MYVGSRVRERSSGARHFLTARAVVGPMRDETAAIGKGKGPTVTDRPRQRRLLLWLLLLLLLLLLVTHLKANVPVVYDQMRRKK